MSIRLVLADDHPIVLEGLVGVLSHEPDLQIVATARDGEEALAAVRKHRPDVLVLDIRMPRKDGLAVIRDMAQEKLPARIVVLTAAEQEEVFDALRMGVRGVVLKDMAAKSLVRCIREVHAGRRWLERGYATHAVEKLLQRETAAKDLADTLTPRELQVARMTARGLRNKVIAQKLAISEGTAKLHLHHVYHKLDIEGRVALAQYLQRRGLV
ncbi:MAG TPA: response regulator transcription factor [Casimicrobiaceae bacterium]|nr:response regulator transcription factor [Casimicrobiaceae bacterium]